MRRECYPNASNFKCLKIAPQNEKFPDWRILDRISADMYVLCQTQNSHVRYGPLYVHSFVLCAPRKIQEATQFNQRYRSYGTIENVPDRLRWYRHSRGLLQKDVAKLIGISRNMYMNIESGTKKQIPNEIVKKLADFYGVPMEAFMDDYNRFLADGQADRIRKYREATGLNKKAFAREKGIPIRCLQEWESGRKTISHGSWERYFKGKA